MSEETENNTIKELTETINVTRAWQVCYYLPDQKDPAKEVRTIELVLARTYEQVFEYFSDMHKTLKAELYSIADLGNVVVDLSGPLRTSLAQLRERKSVRDELLSLRDWVFRSGSSVDRPITQDNVLLEIDRRLDTMA